MLYHLIVNSRQQHRSAEDGGGGGGCDEEPLLTSSAEAAERQLVPKFSFIFSGDDRWNFREFFPTIVNIIMKKSQSIGNSSSTNRKAKNGTNGFLPNSLKFISSCVKTVSSNVRSAGASVASSISAAASDSDDHRKDQVFLGLYHFSHHHDWSTFFHKLLVNFELAFCLDDWLPLSLWFSHFLTGRWKWRGRPFLW